MDFSKFDNLNEKERILNITLKDGTTNEIIFNEMKFDMGFLCIRNVCEDPNTGKLYWVEQAMNMDEIATFVIVRMYDKNER